MYSINVLKITLCLELSRTTKTLEVVGFILVLVSSTGLIMSIGYRKEIRKLMTFRALALRRSESRNCGLCVVYIQKDGATVLVGAWQREKQLNKLVE